MTRHNLLNRVARPPKKGTKIRFTRKTSDEGLILRYCHLLLNYELDELAQLIGLDESEVRKLYYGFRNKAKEADFDRIYKELQIDKQLLLCYAYDWKNNNGIISSDLPFPVRIVGNDGNYTGERFWFQNAWFEENFRDRDNVAVMKITDNVLAPYGFNRGDVVIASRLPEHVLFRTHQVYMLREVDGGIYPRIADLQGAQGSGGAGRILMNPLDKHDVIPFSELPADVSMVGRLVWKSGLI